MGHLAGRRPCQAFLPVVQRCDNHAVTFRETFARRGAIAAALALSGAVAIGCSSPPPMVDANVNLPVRDSPSTTPPVPSASPTPGTFHLDPGFEITADGNTEVSGIGGSSNSVAFECCLGHDWSSSAADPQTWSPGEHVQITWIETARPAAGSPEDTMFLTAKMYGSWSTVADAENSYSSDNQVAAAAVVQWDTESTGSATSVITIPADGAPGYYELQFSAAAQEAGGCGTAACAPGFYDGAIIEVR